MERNWKGNSVALKNVAEAAQRGGLTVLVGAGASRARPAEVKLYHELARDLYGANGKEWQKPAEFFEAIAKKNPRLHKEIAEEVDRAKRPSLVHARVLDLVEAGGARRLLTTNWDRLLEEEAKRRGTPGMGAWPKERRGKAEGARASGIVHLHGCVDEPRSMLVTKGELDAHYEKQEEREFLEEILRGETILCVGYSHRDEMVLKIQREVCEEGIRRAMAGRGQVASLNMYSIVEDSQVLSEMDLEALGITPIRYRTDGNHEEVAEILEYILERTQMDAAAEGRRLEALGERGPVETTDWDEVTNLIRNGGAELDHFLRRADPTHWGNHEMLEAGLKAVFTLKDLTSAEGQLCSWLCHKLNGNRLRNILWLAAASRGVMHPALRHYFGIWLQDKDADLTAEERVMGGLALLGQAKRGGVNDTDVTMLQVVANRCNQVGNHEVALKTLETLTEVQAMPEVVTTGLREDRIEESGGIKAHTVGEGIGMYMFWDEAVRPIIKAAPERVWRTCTKALKEQQRMLDASTGKKRSWNSWSYRRSAIETHEQDDLYAHTSLGVLVEGAREALDLLGNTESGDKQEWERYIAETEGADNPLLRRLALHGVRTGEPWTASQKLDWMTRDGRLDDLDTHHEKYLLLGAVWEGAGERTQDAAASAIRAMKIGPKEEFWERGKYDLIHWLKEGGITHPSLERTAKEIERNHPEWKPREHAEFLHWTTGAQWIGPNEPEGWEAEDLIGKWKRAGEGALDEVIDECEKPRDHATADDWLNGPNTEGRQKAIARAIEEDTQWAVALGRRLAQRGKWRHPAWRPICEKLAGKLHEAEVMAYLQEEAWDSLIERGAKWEVGELLLTAAKQAREEGWPEEAVQTLRRRTAGWIRPLAENEREETDGDWMTHTINAPAGKAIDALLHLMGVPEGTQSGKKETLDALEALWAEGGAVARHVAVLCGQKAGWLHAQDSDWTARTLVKRVNDIGEHDVMRGVLWNGLAYANWHYSATINMLKPALCREIRFAHAPNEGERGFGGAREDTAADRYGYTMAASIVFGKEKYMDWGLAGIPARRRTRIVKRVCGLFWRGEEWQTNGWKEVLEPMWRQLVEGAGPRITPGEQEAFLMCFPYLDREEQSAFKTLFERGPRVTPEYYLDEHHGGREVENREAAIRVFLHCTPLYPKEENRWKWRAPVETLKRWWAEEPTGEQERMLIERALAEVGEVPTKRLI